MAASRVGVECILVDDGSTDGSLEAIRNYPLRIIPCSAGPHGPAFARNRGVEAARGEIVFFIDSDVLVSPDVFSRVMELFERHPQYDAIFGSYDESPGEADFLSQYKNLLHAFVHQQASSEGHTFWSGCGAVRRSVFVELGGFDEMRYSRPSIEDIDLGCRMRAAGHRILLAKDLRVKHLKRWTLAGLLKTDIFDRAIPWTRLILRDRSLPNDLNLSTLQRLSAVLSLGLAGLLGLSLLQPAGWLLLTWIILFVFFTGFWSWMGSKALLPLQRNQVGNGLLFSAWAVMLALLDQSVWMIIGGGALFAGFMLLPLFARLAGRPQRLVYHGLFGVILAGILYQLAQQPIYLAVGSLLLSAGIVLINRRLYRFFYERRGLIFAMAAYPMQVLYYLYSLLAFMIGVIQHLWQVAFKPRAVAIRNE